MGYLIDLGLLALGFLTAVAIIVPTLRRTEHELKVAHAERDLYDRTAVQEGRPLIRYGHQTKL